MPVVFNNHFLETAPGFAPGIMQISNISQQNDAQNRQINHNKPQTGGAISAIISIKAKDSLNRGCNLTLKTLILGTDYGDFRV